MTIKAQTQLGHDGVREQVRKHNEEFDKVVREALNRVLCEEPPELKRLRQTVSHLKAKLESERVHGQNLTQRLVDVHATGEGLHTTIASLRDTLEHREAQLSRALCENVRLQRELNEARGRGCTSWSFFRAPS